MTIFVVDTNVAIAANGNQDADGDIQCHLSCIDKLENVRTQGIVAVDDTGYIFREYLDHLCLSGKPGVGDAFVKHVYDSQYSNDRIQRVKVTLSDDDQKGFEELPKNNFDRGDRKFLAVALVAGAVVLNATDSDWSQSAALIKTLGVKVDELCPHLPKIREKPLGK